MTNDKTSVKAIVVDDEKLARKYLKELLKEHPDIHVVAECANGFEAVKAVAEHKPDLLFLDIQMPKLDGFEVLELIEPGPSVIFVTAYDQFALKAFDAHAVDYLLKPFAASRLTEALVKVRRNLGGPLPPAQEIKSAANPTGSFINRIVIKDGSSVIIVPVERLDYVQADDDYVSIHSEGKSHLKHQTISSLEESLDPARFVRIHRSTIVNVDRIDKVELLAKDRYVSILKDGTNLPISRSGHKKLKAVLS